MKERAWRTGLRPGSATVCGAVGSVVPTSASPQPQFIHLQNEDEDGSYLTRMFWEEERRMWGKQN